MCKEGDLNDYGYLRMSSLVAELVSAIPAARERVLRKRGREIDVDHRIPIAKSDDPRIAIGAEMRDDLALVARRLGITVQYVSKMKWRDALGLSTHTGTVQIRDGGERSDPHVAHVLAHELVHEIFHSDPVVKMPKRDEAEAETCAYLISRIYGCYAVDSPLYLASWSISGELIERYAARSIADAQFILALTGREK